SFSVTSTSSCRTLSRTVSVRSVASFRTATSSTTPAALLDHRHFLGLAHLDCALFEGMARSRCLDRTATFDRHALTTQRDLARDRSLYHLAPHTGRPAIDRALADLDIFLCERNDLFG